MESTQVADQTSLDVVSTYAERSLFALSDFSACLAAGTPTPAATAEDATAVSLFAQHLHTYLKQHLDSGQTVWEDNPLSDSPAYARFHGGTVPHLVFEMSDSFNDVDSVSNCLGAVGCEVSNWYSAWESKAPRHLAKPDETARCVKKAKLICLEFLSHTKLAA